MASWPTRWVWERRYALEWLVRTCETNSAYSMTVCSMHACGVCPDILYIACLDCCVLSVRSILCECRCRPSVSSHICGPWASTVRSWWSARSQRWPTGSLRWSAGAQTCPPSSTMAPRTSAKLCAQRGCLMVTHQHHLWALRVHMTLQCRITFAVLPR